MPTGAAPNAMAFGKLDGGAKPDMVVGDGGESGARTRIYLNNGFPGP